MSRRVEMLSLIAAALLTLFAIAGSAQEIPDGLLQSANLGRCTLDSGKWIEPCLVTYRTFGRLNADHTNAVLFPSWYNGRSEDLAQFFGPDKLVNTSLFFGIAVDALADGISSSPSNSTTQHGANFPAITIRDMVRAEYRLATEALHLKHLYAVVGISMGGMQTYEWLVDYPGFFQKAVPIIGTPQQTSYDLLNWDLLRRLIESDPGFHDGNYAQEPDLALANEFATLTLPSPAYIARTVSRESFPEFLENSLKTWGGRDANDRLVQLKAMIAHDVTRGSGSIEETARKISNSQLIVVAVNDHLVNPAPALTWGRANGAQTYVSQGDCGHRIFECDGPAITAAVRTFLGAP
jgi:homoserine O-acetyltransferase